MGELRHLCRTLAGGPRNPGKGSQIERRIRLVNYPSLGVRQKAAGLPINLLTGDELAFDGPAGQDVAINGL